MALSCYHGLPEPRRISEIATPELTNAASPFSRAYVYIRDNVSRWMSVSRVSFRYLLFEFVFSRIYAPTLAHRYLNCTFNRTVRI